MAPQLFDLSMKSSSLAKPQRIGVERTPLRHPLRNDRGYHPRISKRTSRRTLSSHGRLCLHEIAIRETAVILGPKTIDDKAAASASVSSSVRQTTQLPEVSSATSQGREGNPVMVDRRSNAGRVG
jgi:hypothetical protein